MPPRLTFPPVEFSEGAAHVARGLAFLVGDPDLDDVAAGELTGEELRVVAVVLLALVGGRLLHLRDRAHDAVHAEGAQLPHEVEAGDAGLVDRLWGLEGEDPRRDLAGRGRELLHRHLAGRGVEGGAGDGASVYVESD